MLITLASVGAQNSSRGPARRPSNSAGVGTHRTTDRPRPLVPDFAYSTGDRGKRRGEQTRSVGQARRHLGRLLRACQAVHLQESCLDVMFGRAVVVGGGGQGGRPVDRGKEGSPGSVPCAGAFLLVEG